MRIQMSWMFEVAYPGPVDVMREQTIQNVVAQFGGKQTCHEIGTEFDNVILTIEFSDEGLYDKAYKKLLEIGEFVEDCGYYGED